MLVRDPSVTPEVVAVLARAMGDGAREASLSEYRQGRNSALFGWSVDGSLVCVASVSLDGSRGELVHIATDPACERRGHAKALVNAVVADLELAVLVADTDEDAVNFCRRSGFTVEPLESPWPTPRFRCTWRRS